MQLRLSQILMWLLVAALVVSVGLGLADSFILYALWPIWSSTLILAGCLIPATACASVRERGRLGMLMLSGIVASAIAAALWIVLLNIIMTDPALGETLARGASVPSSWAVATALIGLLALPRFRRTGPHVLRIATMVMVGLTALQVQGWIWLAPTIEGTMTWREANQFHESNMKAFGVLVVLGSAGLVVIYILAKTRDITGVSVPDSERLGFGFLCPRCSKQQQLRTHGDRCGECGLRIKVTPQ